MDWLRYANQGATRSQPLAPGLLEALSFLPELGLTMEVFSGGQAAKGSGGPRTGSTRHDHGNAADVFFYKDGRKLDWANPEDRPLFEQVVSRGRQAGLTGFGAGPNYMQPGSMHLGFGSEAVWGAGGKGANAPGWLQAAFGGQSSAPTGGTDTLVGNQGSDTVEQPMEQPYSGGLLGRMFPQVGQRAQEQGGLLGGFLTPDRRDRLILALEGMTLNPNKGLMASASEGIKDRREGRKETKADQERTKRRNATAQWLRSNGRDDLAQVLETGALDAKTAVGLAFDKGKAPTPHSDPAKLKADLDAGFITREQYDAEIEGMGQAPTGYIATGDTAASLGLDPNFAYNVTVDGGVMKASQIGGNGTTVTINNGAESSEWGEPPKDMVWLRDEAGKVVTRPDASGQGVTPLAVPIAGGPQDTTGTDAVRQQNQERTAQVQLQDISRAKDMIRGNPRLTTGFLGNALSTFAGTQAADLNALLDTIGANISFDYLNRMRQQSPTGGALGQVTERELELLRATAGNIKQAQTPEQLIRNLERLERQISTVVNGEAGGSDPLGIRGM